MYLLKGSYREDLLLLLSLRGLKICKRLSAKAQQTSRTVPATIPADSRFFFCSTLPVIFGSTLPADSRICLVQRFPPPPAKKV